MSYDTKCQILAEAFLSDIGHQNDVPMVKELAQEIQDTIEEFINRKGFEL